MKYKIIFKGIDSNNATVYNLDAFAKGKVNKLFITGASGSGKSYLAPKIAKHFGVSKVIELDTYMPEADKALGIKRNGNEVVRVSKDYWKKLSKFLIQKIESDTTSSEKAIIEGVWIQQFDKNYLSKNALIILNTSVAQSIANNKSKNINDQPKDFDKFIEEDIKNVSAFKEKINLNYQTINLDDITRK